MNKRKRHSGHYNKPEPYRVNRRINALKVRLVGEGIESDVYSIEQALKIAEQAGKDLVEISPKAEPPVCKVIDYSKFKYEQKKKEKLIRSKSQKVFVKEIRLTPNTNEHDLAFKVRHAQRLLKEGAKLKVVIRFTGREVKFPERGEVILLKFAQALEDYSKVEQMPKLEGRRMSLLMSSKVKKSSVVQVEKK